MMILDQFQFRTEEFRKSLFPDCVRKWNNLERDLRKECSYNSFRSKITPIVTCSDLYFVGLGKFNIIHAHLRSLHCINSPACVCSQRVEETAHFFLDCAVYNVQRLALRNTVSRFSHFDQA